MTVAVRPQSSRFVRQLRRRSRNVNGLPTGLEILKHAIDRFGILITGGDRIEVLFREVILDAQHPQTHADRK
jgi:hypothetical protein